MLPKVVKPEGDLPEIERWCLRLPQGLKPTIFFAALPQT